MKFGRNLPQFTVPEWSASYIKYKALKKLIKSAAEKVKAGQEADLAGKCDSSVSCETSLAMVAPSISSLTRIPRVWSFPHD